MQLTDPIQTHFRLQETQKKALKRLKLETIEDLLYHFPNRYETTKETKKIQDIASGESVELYGTLSGLKIRKAFKSKIPLAEAKLSDNTGTIKLIWLHQPYIAKLFHDGMVVKVVGKVSDKNDTLALLNPTVEKTHAVPETLFYDTGTTNTHHFPVYRESRGITSRWFFYAIDKIIKSGVLTSTQDPLPEAIRTKYNLPHLRDTLLWIHKPKQEANSETARKRLGFEEVFLIQLKKQQERHNTIVQESFEIQPDKDTIQEFIGRFPFTPTGAQTKAVQEIIEDISSPGAMSRLLEGDVGSGKTFVAAVASYAITKTYPKNQTFGNLQVAYMAPTEILATQLFESFIELFKDLPIQIGLITSSGCKKFPSKVQKDTWTTISRAQLLKWVANGEIPILIGTHSLIQKTVLFKHLALVIIDEQHRFGTFQRQKLTKKTTIIPLQCLHGRKSHERI